MKWLVIPLLGVFFVTLIAGSTQSVTADHLELDQGIFKDRSEVDLVTTHNSDYQVYLQAVLRNGDNQLINVTETTATGAYIPHEITDYVFDTLMGKKEIIIIDNIKYEKVQYMFTPTLEQRWMGMYPILGNPITININVEGDALVQINEINKDHNVWKIHYCADFANIGHPGGVQCIPIFQVLVPTMTLEPTDVINQQWTILRELN